MAATVLVRREIVVATQYQQLKAQISGVSQELFATTFKSANSEMDMNALHKNSVFTVAVHHIKESTHRLKHFLFQAYAPIILYL
jgi:hypothetical protein